MAAESRFAIWLSATRPRTLPAAIAPVVVGTAFALQHGSVVWYAASACLAFALLVQVGTNFANDYGDFAKGADNVERVGPRRAVAAGLIPAATMKRAAGLVFAAAFLVGLTLLPYGGWPLLAIGITSIACGYAYTGGSWPIAYIGLGDAFVFVFFGLVAVGATYFVQAGSPGMDVWLAAVAIGLLAANILIVNNYRDVQTDARAGKRTSVVRFGRRFARWQFASGHAVALLVPVIIAMRWDAFGWILLPLFLTPEAVRQALQLKRSESPKGLIDLLGDVGRYLAAYSLLLSAGIVCT
ncbi:MAG TPA: 1,4-dihydroxy-2-naphthoate polyprenyltransferase [Opitutaceae bacterium]|nr:1,4-dihydroxy-2-naphthoate polyprenyltransferase [Opitutaceae bacterium]